jgi:hypothetical protein
MTGGSGSQKFGDALERLKVASGLSYESIGRKVHLSKSAVHRYCTGATVPREFGTVERIATLCRANQTDMTSLHYLWLRAKAADNGGPAMNGRLYPEKEAAPPAPAPQRWSTLDRLVRGARNAGLPPLFVFGSTPRWPDQTARTVHTPTAPPHLRLKSPAGNSSSTQS